MKQIRVTDAQRDELHSKKQPGDSYADVLKREYGVGEE
jgi:predicted CopG family antitoxin